MIRTPGWGREGGASEEGEARPGEGREEIEMEGRAGKRGREREVGESQAPF